MKEKKALPWIPSWTADDLKELANQFKAEYKAKIGEDFPSDPKEQLMGADQRLFSVLGTTRANRTTEE